MGIQLRKIRLQRKLPQYKLGQVLDMPQSRISDMERGKRRIYLDEAVKLARFLEISLDELVEQ